MQKIIKLETENTPLERWTENSACEIYSHDNNNGHFEIEVMNEALTDETVTALFIFEESESVWRTEGIIEENKIKFKFDTTLITQDETVVCVLYLDNERENNDFYRFSFKVKISEIDKLDNLTIKERLFKNNLIIDRLEAVTKDELKEALKNLDLSSISTEGLLTEEKANGLYAKISELEAVESKIITQEQLTTTKNEVVTEINNMLENYALKTNIPEPYNDTSLVSRVSDLERKTDKDTIYDDSDLRNRVTNLESIDTSKFVTDEKLESKGYLKSHQDITGLATKEELANLVTNDQLEAKHYITGAALENYALKLDIPQGYNDTEVKERLTVLENKQDKDTIYNDTELRNRVSELEQRPIATPYNDTALSDRVSALETKQDKDTVYNDEPIKERLTALESKPNIDLTGYATKQELKNKVDNSDYDTFKSMVVTKGYLESKNYLTEQYNDKPLTDRVVALESKTTTNQWEIHGTGMPNGVVEAELGTTYVDKNKTNGALKWIKTTNGGNQGWEVLIGDTGWRNLNSTSKLKVGDKTSFIKIRRVNNLVTYQFGGLQWGWFGIIRRNGPGFVKHNSSGDKGVKVLGVSGIPEGFRSETSLVGPTYDDKGRPYGIWYLGGKTDSNFIQFTFNEDIPTDRDIGDIRVSTISYLTEEPWPTKLP